MDSGVIAAATLGRARVSRQKQGSAGGGRRWGDARLGLGCGAAGRGSREVYSRTREQTRARWWRMRFSRRPRRPRYPDRGQEDWGETEGGREKAGERGGVACQLWPAPKAAEAAPVAGPGPRGLGGDRGRGREREREGERGRERERRRMDGRKRERIAEDGGVDPSVRSGQVKYGGGEFMAARACIGQREKAHQRRGASRPSARPLLPLARPRYPARW